MKPKNIKTDWFLKIKFIKNVLLRNINYSIFYILTEKIIIYSNVNNFRYIYTYKTFLKGTKSSSDHLRCFNVLETIKFYRFVSRHFYILCAYATLIDSSSKINKKYTFRIILMLSLKRAFICYYIAIMDSFKYLQM